MARPNRRSRSAWPRRPATRRPSRTWAATTTDRLGPACRRRRQPRTEGSTDNSYDFGFVRTGSIGNYVWLDENSDGYQDAGEAGIPNVRVWLKDSAGTTIATTYTDAQGGYVFSNLTANNTTYYVDVDETTLPGGHDMYQTPFANQGADFGNQNQTARQWLPGHPLPGQENLTADFGFNYRPSTDVNGNTNNGAIGDRVWLDANGDGQQDPDELGIAGVTVQLYTTRTATASTVRL